MLLFLCSIWRGELRLSVCISPWNCCLLAKSCNYSSFYWSAFCPAAAALAHPHLESCPPFSESVRGNQPEHFFGSSARAWAAASETLHERTCSQERAAPTRHSFFPVAGRVWKVSVCLQLEANRVWQVDNVTRARRPTVRRCTPHWINKEMSFVWSWLQTWLEVINEAATFPSIRERRRRRRRRGVFI